MRLEPSTARAQSQTAAPKAAERKPELQPAAEQPARPEAAKPSQQAVKNNLIDVRA